MTSIYRCSSKRSISAGGGKGLVDRAGQVAEVVEGRARGRSWGKNPSWAIPIGPVLKTTSAGHIPAKYIRISMLSLI